MLEKQAKKGRLVSVVGKLASRKYRRDGEETDRTVTEIVVDLRGEIDFPTPPVAQVGAAQNRRTGARVPQAAYRKRGYRA